MPFAVKRSFLRKQIRFNKSWQNGPIARRRLQVESLERRDFLSGCQDGFEYDAVMGGAAANGTLTMTPSTGACGSAEVAISATESGTTVYSSFQSTMLPTPAVVYVDDDFSLLNTDDDPAGPGTRIGYDSFASIQDGVDAVAAGGEVIVNPGTYDEAVSVARDLTLTSLGSVNLHSLSSTASSSLGFSGSFITDGAGINFAGPALLTNDATLVAAGTGGVTFDAPVDGGRGLTIYGGSNDVVLGNVGATAALGGLYVSTAGTTSLLGDIHTDSGIVYFLGGGNVAIQGDRRIDTESGNDQAGGAVDMSSKTLLPIGDGARLAIDTSSAVHWGGDVAIGGAWESGFHALDALVINTGSNGGSERIDIHQVTEILQTVTLTSKSININANLLHGAGSIAMTGAVTLNGAKIVSSSGAMSLNGSLSSAANESPSELRLPLNLLGDNRIITVADGPAEDDLIFDSGLSNGGLIKEGPGKLKLNRDDQSIYQAVINGGTLQVDRRLLAAAFVAVNNTGTLAGNGEIVGEVIVGTGGHVAPGASPGILKTGNLSLIGSTYHAELNGIMPGTEYDQLDAAGSVTLGGVTLDATLGFAPSDGDSVVLINNDGTDAVTGEFQGLPEGASVTIGGHTFEISYQGGTGNDVVLSIPSPLAMSDITDQLMNEDQPRGPLTFTVSDGGDPGATLSLQASSSNPTLFPAGSLQFAGSGANRSLTLVPAANKSGTATITVTLTSSAGGSVSDTLDVTVVPVNDAPSLQPGGTIVVPYNSGAQAIPWATNFRAGPADEIGQSLSIQVIAIGGPSYFSAPPTIGLDGILRFTPAPGAIGAGGIGFRLRDDGGTDAGGVDESSIYSVDITFAPPNVPPRITSLTSPAADCSPSRMAATVVSGTFDDLDSGSHTVMVDWGDGTSSPATVDAIHKKFTASHTYVSASTTSGDSDYVVTATISDGANQDAESLELKGAGAFLVGGVVEVAGSALRDSIVVAPVAGSSPARFTVEFRPMNGPGQIYSFLVADVTAINMRLCAGNDAATVIQLPTIAVMMDGGLGADSLSSGGGPAILIGGGGSDNLRAGPGGAVLVGGADNDYLYGGSGADLLIGGTGVDYLFGLSTNDIFVGGTTVYDDDIPALQAIQQEWRKPTSFVSRKTALQTGILSGSRTLRLQVDNTVLSDAVVDQIFGGTTTNWRLDS